MRRYILLALLSLFAFCNSALASKRNASKKNEPKAPTIFEFSPIGDSIMAEGVLLYGYEKISWMTSDSMQTHCKKLQDIGRYTVYEDEGVLTCIFTDRKEENVVFCGKGKVDELPFGLQWSNEVRPITAGEKDAINTMNKCFEKISAGYGDSIYNVKSAQGQINIDIIKKKNGYRVYILQGTTIMGVIPYGNDYIIDFDKNFNITSFNRCHKTYLAIPVESTDSIKTTVHSHTPDNPYISVTDVCTSLLYGRDLYGIKQFMVVSTHFSNKFVMFMDAEKLTLVGMNETFIKNVYGK